MSSLAAKIFSLNPTSASCERLFSELKIIKSEKRNRMKNDLLFDLAVIRSTISKEEREKRKIVPISISVDVNINQEIDEEKEQINDNQEEENDDSSQSEEEEESDSEEIQNLIKEFECYEFPKENYNENNNSDILPLPDENDYSIPLDILDSTRGMKFSLENIIQFKQTK